MPPRKRPPQEVDGKFVSRRGFNRSTAYSIAIRELMEAPDKKLPPTWDPKNLTAAQELAMRHLALAKAGNPVFAQIVVDRAEGKVPLAQEDREAIESGSGLKLLADILGIRTQEQVEIEVLGEPLPELPPAPKENET